MTRQGDEMSASALDDYILHMTQHAPGHATLTMSARAEIAQLRATVAAQVERIKDFESALHCDSCGVYLVYPEDADPFCPFCELEKARATIAAQAEQLRDAREILDNIFKHDWSNRKLLTRAQDWLAAPAPQAQPPEEPSA